MTNMLSGTHELVGQYNYRLVVISVLQAMLAGYASIDLRIRGHLTDPASLSVSQKIEFKPPRQMPPEIARLRNDFVFRAEDGCNAD